MSAQNVDKTQLKTAETYWDRFMKATTYVTISVIVVLCLMAFFLL